MNLFLLSSVLSVVIVFLSVYVWDYIGDFPGDLFVWSCIFTSIGFITVGFLKTYVTQKKGSKITLNAFQAFDDDEVIKIAESFELKRKDDKNFIAKLVSSGIANGLKAGLVNSYQSYGIAPGALAIMGMTGKALIEADTEDSFALSQGESINIKKAEEK